MAPAPDATTAATTTSPSPKPSLKSDMSLPGMKRGVAIGVAASVAILLIGILTYLALQRRRKLAKAQNQTEWPRHKVLMQNPETKEWNISCPLPNPPLPPLPPTPPPPPPADTENRSIHELEAGVGTIPELPTPYPTQELEGDKIHVQELDSGATPSLPPASVQKADSCRKWSTRGLTLDTHFDDVHGQKRNVPTLSFSISPPDNASPFGISPLGSSPLGPSPVGVSPEGSASPLLVSPLDQVYFTSGRQTRPDGWI